MYGLLMALQDVIGSSSSDEDEIVLEHSITSRDAFDSKTLVTEFSTASTTPRNLSPFSDDSGHASTTEDDPNDLLVFGGDVYHSDNDDRPTVRLPVAGISLPPPPPRTETPSELSHPSELEQRSLLSPVSLTLSPTCNVTLPTLGREDSVDSGYADCEPWSGPEPLAKSPPSKAHGVTFSMESLGPGSQSLGGELRGSKTWVRVFENREEVHPSGIALPLNEDAEEEMVTNFVIWDEDEDTPTPAFLKSETSYRDEISPTAIALPLSPPSPPTPSSPDLEFPSFSEFVQASRTGTPIQFINDEEDEGIDPRGIALPLSPDLSSSSGFLSFSQVVQSTLPLLNEGTSSSFGDVDPAAQSLFALPVQDEQGPVTPTPTHHPLPLAPSLSHKQKWGAVMNELSMLLFYTAPLEEKETEQGKERLFSVTPQVKDETLGEVNEQEVTTSSVYSQQAEKDASKEDLMVPEPRSSAEEPLSTSGTVLDFPLPPTDGTGVPSSSTQCVSTPPLTRGQIVSPIPSASNSSSSSSFTPPASTRRVFTPPSVGAGTISSSPPSPLCSSSSASSPTPPAPTSALPLTRGGEDTNETIRPGPYQSQRAVSLSSLRIKLLPSTPWSIGNGKGKAPMKDADKCYEWDEAMEAGNVSTKVPFGFRYPYSLVCSSCSYHLPLSSQVL